MNNEMNNNVNNTGNHSGINFVQGGTPAAPTPVPPQQPVYQQPVQPPIAPAPAEMPTAGNMTAPIAPQPVNPQPIEAAPVNFVASNPPTPAPMPAPGVASPAPMDPEMPAAQPPMSGVPPVAPMPTMQPQPNMGPMPGQMPPSGMPNNANVAPPAEGEKEKLPIVMIIITVLVVAGVAVFLIMYLTGKINFGKKNPATPTPGVKEPTNAVVLADWMNYILDQNPTEIRINRYIDADNTKSVNINEEELKNLFTTMKDYRLVKYYSSTRSVANDDLQITYVKDGVTYSFTLSGENVTIGDDASLKTLFENGTTDIEDDGQTTRECEDYNYILKNFDSNIYDEYFAANETENTTE